MDACYKLGFTVPKTFAFPKLAICSTLIQGAFIVHLAFANHAFSVHSILHSVHLPSALTVTLSLTSLFLFAVIRNFEKENMKKKISIEHNDILQNGIVTLIYRTKDTGMLSINPSGLP